MRRYVIDAPVALELGRTGVRPGKGVQLVAPTLIRSQLVSRLYRDVRSGELTRQDAERWLDHIRSLRIRVLGDRVLLHVAWDVADHLGWPDTLDRKSTRLNSSHVKISYAVFCLKKKKTLLHFN